MQIRNYLKAIILSALCMLAGSCIGGKGGNRGNTPTPPDGNDTTKMARLQPADHPIVNVYLENSGSMNGYVDGGKTLFQQDVYNYLCDISISNIPSKLNLHFINSTIIDKGSIIEDFINKLTPNSFRTSGGNKTTTDIADIFKQILAHTDDNTVSIFISDCIFSPGNINSPEAYLVNQQVGIKKCVADYLAQHTNFAIFVYQLYSNFNGTYYDYKNRPRKYIGKRPYYIWVMGHPLHLEKLRSAIPNNRFGGNGIANEWCAHNKTFDGIAYSIVSKPVSGDFTRKAKNAISQIKKGPNGTFAFRVTANLSPLELLLGNDYLMDPNNYSRLINKQDSEEWHIEIERNTNPSSPATHNITLSTSTSIPRCDLNIAIRCMSPQWALTLTDFDDSAFSQENQDKTYGLKYLFDGVQQAFNAKSSGIYGGIYTVMDFKLN